MVRLTLTLLAAVDGARLVLHSATNQSEFPIPTPDGYKFNYGMMGGCYAAGGNQQGTATADKPPAGYKVNKGHKCPGAWIDKWENGKSSGYGSGLKDITACAVICNQHENCAGFYTNLGDCSYYRSGELQDLEGKASPGHDCFVKWEVRDLSGDVAPPPDFSGFVPGTVTPPKGKQISDCLCVWDIDRTLTAKQGMQDQCPGTKHYSLIKDYAYNGGTLILSELAMSIQETFCGQCYFGIVSAGTASGPDSPNRGLLDALVDEEYNVGDWVDGCPVPTWGTKILCCDEGQDKKNAVTDVVSWLSGHDINIAPEKVHFFDDKRNNIEAMGEGPAPHYNAHQVSCGSRDGSRGGCGGLTSEVVDTLGQHFC